MTTAAEKNVYVALHGELLRVNALRLRLDRRDPRSVLEEFMLRRKLKMAAAAYEKGTVTEVLRWACALRDLAGR